MLADSKIYRVGVPVTRAVPPFFTGKIVAKAEMEGPPPPGRSLTDLIAVRWRHNNVVELVDWRVLVTPAHGPAGIRVYRRDPVKFGRIAQAKDKTPGVARLMAAAAALKNRVVVIWDDNTRSVEKLKDLTTIPPVW